MPKIQLICIFCTIITLYAESCDVLISGGTLASLGAAINAPQEYNVCLIQPTSRLGGQLGDEGVWHFDFNWLYQKNYPDTKIAYNPDNIHPFITQVMNRCNTGDCWVSRSCFMYSCVQPIIQQYLARKENLTIFYNTTIKSLGKIGSTIIQAEIITRLPLAQPGIQEREDCRSVNQVIDDWYTRQPSQYYRKVVKKIGIRKFVIQASQYGDTLVLSNASYMQGTQNSTLCGQSIVFGIHQIYKQNNLQAQKINEEFDDNFSLGGYSAEQVWRYRRLFGKGLGIKQGEISLQNWNGPGNDYRKGYLFVDAHNSISNWKGGLNFTTLKEAEKLSLRFHEWFKNVSGLPLQLYKKQLGTCLGTTRLPYVRDGRRSIGYKDFMMKEGDVTGVYVPGGNLTAPIFQDRVSIGMYNMDLHSIQNCSYEPFAQNIPLPFFIPLRAYSNKDFSNLIVAGRSIAQTFFVSSATRTHATQIATGSAASIISLFMMRNNIPSIWALIDCQQCIKTYIPLEWTINEKKYPDIVNTSSMELQS